MKKLIPLLLLFMLLGCSDPKNTQIPTETSQMEEITPQLQKLSEEERKLFASYVLRHMLSKGLLGASSGQTNIPPGTTIKQAINEQRAFEENFHQEEARQKELRDQVILQTKIKTDQMTKAVTVTVVDKKLAQETSEYSGIVIDEVIEVRFAYRNNTQKSISGVKGTITILDLFGDVLSGFNISNDTTIPAGQHIFWDGSRSVKYSFTQNQDRKWAEMTQDKYKIVWTPEKIVFSDGTEMNNEI